MVKQPIGLLVLTTTTNLISARTIHDEVKQPKADVFCRASSTWRAHLPDDWKRFDLHEHVDLGAEAGVACASR